LDDPATGKIITIMKIAGILKNTVIVLLISFVSGKASTQETYEYTVAKLTSPIVIDASWDKPTWKGVDSIQIDNISGARPEFTPITYVKMLYDDQNIYVIFKVQDRFVRCVTHEINGPVWEDACVEFFFSPDMASPGKYFNLEVTGGGTPLICYNTFPRELNFLDTTDIKEIKIAHSLPVLVPNELTDSVTWTVEYKIPVSLLEKYANVSQPCPGINWMANFYKCASNNSNPHYLSWAKVESPSPNFHLPEFFGKLVFGNTTLIETVADSGLEMYPNPATDFIYFKGLNKAGSVRIFNTLGYQEAIHSNVIEKLNISELKEGIYYVNMIAGDKSFTQKIIKR